MQNATFDVDRPGSLCSDFAARPCVKVLRGGLVLVLISASAWAGDPCVKVTQKTLADGVELWADLSTCTEVTMSVTADETNVVNELPPIIDSAGRTHFLAAKWKQLDRDAAWKLKDWKYRWKLGRRLVVPPATVSWKRPFAGTFKLIQGPRGTFSHFDGSQDEEAYDWEMPEGTPVLAARDGVVVGVRSDCSVGAVDEALKNENNYVVLRHDDGLFSEYNHLRQGGVTVKLGDKVTAGQQLGESGNTGYTSKPHLHFSAFHTIDGTLRQEVPVSFNGAKPARRVGPDEKIRKAVQEASDGFEAIDAK